MKRVIIFFISCLAIGSSFAQQLIEQVDRTTNFYDIPFSKYKLENGLTIILHQDTAVSNVYVNMLYKVGSANETDGRRGYAHFFEHLMFAGTKTLSKSQLWDLFPKTNSTIMNAETSYEFTMYEEEVPANYLETALWLESQRLLYTPDFMNEKNVAIQKQIILNEMAMRMEDDMFGILDKNQKENMYDQQYPYHHPVIGYKEDIQKATLGDIRDFFVKWYVPNNAILSISGNFDTKHTLALINKYFSAIQQKPLPEMNIKNISDLKSAVIRDLQYDISFPTYTITYPTVKRWSPDEAALDALSYLLSKRDNLQRFSDASGSNVYQQAILLQMNHPCSRFGGEFKVMFRTKDIIDKPERLMHNTLEKARKITFLQENIEEYKEYFKSLMYNRFIYNRNIAYQLAQYELLLNTPNGLPVEWKRNMSLTQEGILKMIDTYLYKKPFVSINILPYTDKQKNKNRKKLSSQISSAPQEDLWNTTENEGMEAEQESIKDVPKESPQQFPKINYWKARLANNIQIIGSSGNANVPTSVLSVRIKAGLLYNKIEYAGISQLYVSVLKSIIQFNNIQSSLERTGGDVSLSAGDEDITIQLAFPDEQLNHTVTLLDSILFHTNLSAADFITIMNFYNSWAPDVLKESPFFATNAMLRKSLYSTSDVFNFSVLGSEITIREITNVNNFAEEIMGLLRSNVKISYVGNLPKDSVLQGLSGLEIWKTDTAKNIVNIPVSIQPSETTILFYDKIDASQSNIDIGIKTTTNQSVKDYTKLQLVNYILGETFTSRLNSRLREEKGLAYFCNSEIPNSKYDDILHVRTNINIEKTDSAIRILTRELDNFIAKGVSQKELEKAKTSLLYRLYEIPETPAQKAEYLLDITSMKNFMIYNNQQIQLVKQIDTVSINQFIKDYFKPEVYQIAIVSDKIKVMPRLKKLNYKIIDYTDKLY